jgi:hypothetical protein
LDKYVANLKVLMRLTNLSICCSSNIGTEDYAHLKVLTQLTSLSIVSS